MPETNDLQRVAMLLGGTSVLDHVVTEPLEAHEMLLKGLPGIAFAHLLDNLGGIRRHKALGKAVGMGVRTFQRTRKKPAKLLNQDQSARTWKFAEVLAKATMVFGTQTAAEQWLQRPATGLDQHCPIDLLATPAGVELVEQFLKRLDYGVYV